MCFIVEQVDGHIEKKNGSKYLASLSIDGNKKELRKNIEIWD